MFYYSFYLSALIWVFENVRPLALGLVSRKRWKKTPSHFVCWHLFRRKIYNTFLFIPKRNLVIIPWFWECYKYPIRVIIQRWQAEANTHYTWVFVFKRWSFCWISVDRTWEFQIWVRQGRDILFTSDHLQSLLPSQFVTIDYCEGTVGTNPALVLSWDLHGNYIRWVTGTSSINNSHWNV